MARKVSEIKSNIAQNFMSNQFIASSYGLDPNASFENQFSILSFENQLFTVMALVIFTLELIFDTHKAEIDTALANQKKGSKLWYRNMALDFQYGFDLITDSDQFNNTGYTAEQIEASKIIKYAAVTESDAESRLIIKVATENAAEVLAPINETQKLAFDYYIDEINYAGVKYTIINYAPDRLQLNLTIKIDPKVIDTSGTKILMSATDVGTKPIETALAEFMKELPFDGKLVLNALIDKLQSVEGVVNPILNAASTSWIDVNTQGYGSMQSIYGEVLPVAGYFTWSLDNVEYKTVISYVV